MIYNNQAFKKKKRKRKYICTSLYTQFYKSSIYIHISIIFRNLLLFPFSPPPPHPYTFIHKQMQTHTRITYTKHTQRRTHIHTHCQLHSCSRSYFNKLCQSNKCICVGTNVVWGHMLKK